MKIRNTLIFQLTIAIIIGILIAKYAYLSLGIFAASSIVLLVCFFVISIIKKGTSYASIFLFFTALSVGGFSYNVHQENNLKHHYSNVLNETAPASVIFEVKTVLKPSTKYYRYTITIKSLNNKPAQGTVLLYLDKATHLQLQLNNRYYTKASLQEIQAPKNPFQFNYKAYLASLNIDHCIYSNATMIKKLMTGKPNLKTTLYHFKEQLKKKIHDVYPQGKIHAIIDALLLGDRLSLDKELYQNYVYAGGIHLLAVSGLHVGIIAFLLGFLLKPLLLLKKGTYIRLIVLVFLLWLYVVFTGNSSSVVRAVSMFTIYAFAYIINRKQKLIDIVFVSIFLLLLIQPNYLFDIGFQLSYCAILGIITIHPLFRKLYNPKKYLQKIVWGTLTVSICAQVGVLPLSLYYFHYFPLLFLITNLLVLPFLGIILSYGLIILILLAFNIDAYILYEGYNGLILLLNTCIVWIASKEVFVIKDISFNLWLLFSSYLTLYYLISFFYDTLFKTCISLLLSIFIFQTLYVISYVKTSHDQLVIFHLSKETLIARQKNHHIIVYSNNNQVNSFSPITDYKTGNFINTVKQRSLSNVINYNEKLILIVDSLGVYQNISFKPDVVLLTHSPKLNLERLIEILKPHIIIADGSNYKSYVHRWSQTCKKKKLPFHSTYEKGAYIISE